MLDDGTQPIIMLSGGVGITPMVAMLQGLVSARRGGAPRREVYFIHAARNVANRAFRGELEALARQHDWLHLFTAYSAPGAGDRLRHTHDTEARLNMEMLAELLPFGGYQFYLCGPEGFMRALYTGLRGMGIDRLHIHYEFFGAGELDEPKEIGPAVKLPARATVTFAHSEAQAEWNAQSGTLLETAEAAGLKPSYHCRSGKCGTCATRLLSGSVHYTRKPLVSPADGHVLTCCAVPMGEQVEIGL